MISKTISMYFDRDEISLATLEEFTRQCRESGMDDGDFFTWEHDAGEDRIGLSWIA